MLSNRLQLLFLEQPDKSQAGLARATGARPPSISDWVNGKTKTINSKYLSAAAQYFGVRSDWLATGEGEMLVSPATKLDTYGAQLMILLAAIPQDQREAAYLAATQLLLDRVIQAAKQQPQLPAPADKPAD